MSRSLKNINADSIKIVGNKSINISFSELNKSYKNCYPSEIKASRSYIRKMISCVLTHKLGRNMVVNLFFFLLNNVSEKQDFLIVCVTLYKVSYETVLVTSAALCLFCVESISEVPYLLERRM